MPPDEARIEFQKLIVAFKSLAAKSAARFAGAVADSDLMMVIDLLNAVAKRQAEALGNGLRAGDGDRAGDHDGERADER